MKIIEHETPAGPHELGDSSITLLMTHEEFDAFYAALEQAEADESPKPKLEKLMTEEGPWDE